MDKEVVKDPFRDLTLMADIPEKQALLLFDMVLCPRTQVPLPTAGFYNLPRDSASQISWNSVSHHPSAWHPTTKHLF